MSARTWLSTSGLLAFPPPSGIDVVVIFIFIGAFNLAQQVSKVRARTTSVTTATHYSAAWSGSALRQQR
jgi:hypothetical protein